MTRNINIRTAVMALAVMMTASCSVKEDRTPCPCWLEIDITGCASHTTEVTVAAWSRENIFSDKVSVADYPDSYEKTVDKGMIYSCAYCGISKSTIRDRHNIIAEGNQADQLRVHAALVNCTGESARDSVVLDRQYATVHLSLKGEDEETYPYDIEVRGDICGIDMTSLEPVEGAFRYRPETDSDGTWIFRLPRQKTGSRITAEVFLDGKPVDEFPLDKWISQSGYSWLERDLKDIYIGVDYTMGTVSIAIQDWVEGEYMDIIL